MADTPEVPTTGTATPLVELTEDQISQSLKVSLADLTAKATALYAQKNYEEASDLFAQAAEMQSEMNGEMNPENSEILFLYGRSLFQVGQSKSDVLGGKAPDAKKNKKSTKPAKEKKANGGAAAAAATVEGENGKIIEKAIADAATAQGVEAKEEAGAEKKALFQFQGDENFVDSDEEEEVGRPLLYPCWSVAPG